MFTHLLLLGASSGAALLVSPRPAHISRPVIRLARPTALELDPPPPESEKQQQLNDAQFGVLERAQDPFRLIRLVVYGIFGVVSVAGISIAVYDLGKDPQVLLQQCTTRHMLDGGSTPVDTHGPRHTLAGALPGTALVNLGTNVVLGGAVGAAFYFDKSALGPPSLSAPTQRHPRLPVHPPTIIRRPGDGSRGDAGVQLGSTLSLSGSRGDASAQLVSPLSQRFTQAVSRLARRSAQWDTALTAFPGARETGTRLTGTWLTSPFLRFTRSSCQGSRHTTRPRRHLRSAGRHARSLASAGLWQPTAAHVVDHGIALLRLSR